MPSSAANREFHSTTCGLVTGVGFAGRKNSTGSREYVLFERGNDVKGFKFHRSGMSAPTFLLRIDL